MPRKQHVPGAFHLFQADLCSASLLEVWEQSGRELLSLLIKDRGLSTGLAESAEMGWQSVSNTRAFGGRCGRAQGGEEEGLRWCKTLSRDSKRDDLAIDHNPEIETRR